MATDVRVIVDEAEVKKVAARPEIRDALVGNGWNLVPGIQARAPHDTGAGAASIQSVAVMEDGEWTARVSWDREHYYMSFHQLGTKSLPARPFLEE